MAGDRKLPETTNQGKPHVVSLPSQPSPQRFGRDPEDSPTVTWKRPGGCTRSLQLLAPEGLLLHLTSSLVHRDQNALRCLEGFGAGVYILCNQAPASFVSAMAGTGCLSDICCKEGFVRIVHLHCWASCRCLTASTSSSSQKTSEKIGLAP